jgi:hypothetical protein
VTDSTHATSATPGQLGHRLQVATFGLVLLILTIAAGLHVTGDSPFARLPGDDLIPSYMAGTFVRTGHAERLMDFTAAKQFQADLRRAEGLEQHGRTGPWLNPPFFALLFAPLSALPYRSALVVWCALNLAMLATSVALLYRMFPAPRGICSHLIILAGLLGFSMPCLQAMACQQNTFLSLLILTSVVTLWRADRVFLAGAVAGLLAFKPQLALLIWAALAAGAGWRAVAGAAVSAGLLGLITLIFLPGTISDYLTRLPESLPYLQPGKAYPWERQVTFHGFFRLLLQGRSSGESLLVVRALWMLCAGTIGALLIWALYGARRAGNISPRMRDRLIAASITAMPLLMPYYMDYDLLLLAIPTVLLACERTTKGPDPVRRAMIVLWTALFACLFVNAAIAEATGINVTVILMAALAAMSARRVVPRQSDIESVDEVAGVDLPAIDREGGMKVKPFMSYAAPPGPPEPMLILSTGN